MQNVNIPIATHRVFVFVETRWNDMPPQNMVTYLLGINAAIPELFEDIDFLVDICLMKDFIDRQLPIAFEFPREAIYQVDSGRVQP